MTIPVEDADDQDGGQNEEGKTSNKVGNPNHYLNVSNQFSFFSTISNLNHYLNVFNNLSFSYLYQWVYLFFWNYPIIFRDISVDNLALFWYVTFGTINLLYYCMNYSYDIQRKRPRKDQHLTKKSKNDPNAPLITRIPLPDM